MQLALRSKSVIAQCFVTLGFGVFHLPNECFINLGVGVSPMCAAGVHRAKLILTNTEERALRVATFTDRDTAGQKAKEEDPPHRQE